MSRLMPQRDRKSFLLERRRLWIAVCLSILALMLVWMIPRCPRVERLRGVLVDLELAAADPGRYAILRDAFTNRLSQEVPSLANCRITLEYIHFSELSAGLPARDSVDFLVLSPQGTPWHRYTGNAAVQLARAKQLIRSEAAAARGLPILGICGGHQFLAMAFGGKVDFIDPAFRGKSPAEYPAEAISERGVVTLKVLRSDPILQGVASGPGTFRAFESHYEEVKTVPRPLINIASSRLSRVQFIRYPGRPVYGTAFHPERCWTEQECPDAVVPEGRRILANFMGMVLQWKKRRANISKEQPHGRNTEKQNQALPLDRP